MFVVNKVLDDAAIFSFEIHLPIDRLLPLSSNNRFSIVEKTWNKNKFLRFGPSFTTGSGFPAGLGRLAGVKC